MSLSILGVLMTAQYNVKSEWDVQRALGISQLNNAITQLEKGNGNVHEEFKEERGEPNAPHS